MNKNHYCAPDQHKRLWELGLRIKAIDNPFSCGELLDLLPNIIYIDHIEYELEIYKDNELWGLLYLNRIYGDPIYRKFTYKEDIYYESLAQLAADRLIWLLKEKLISIKNITK